MKPRKPSIICNSFEDLKTLLKTQSISLPNRRHSDVPIREIELTRSAAPSPAFEGGAEKRPSGSTLSKPWPSGQGAEGLTPELEEKLFKTAMEGVTPIPKDKYIGKNLQIELPEGSREKEDAEALRKLTELIRHGTGFRVSDTPEYIEGTGYNVSPSIAKRLHRGDFSIQAHVDLHGLGVDDAKGIFEEFLDWAVTTGKRGVLIVHGRGLSSPAEPILKNKVKEWLTRGPWRKWVVAYASARRCDGGAGATYLLLRQRPVTKRLKVRGTKATRKS